MNSYEAASLDEDVREYLLEAAEADVREARAERGTIRVGVAIAELLRLMPSASMVEFVGPQQPDEGSSATITLLVADGGEDPVVYRFDDWFRPVGGGQVDPHDLEEALEPVQDLLGAALADDVEFPAGPDGTFQLLLRP
jgi:hypothetical protein